MAAKDLAVGVEGEGGATPIGGGADFLIGPKGLPRENFCA